MWKVTIWQKNNKKWRVKVFEWNAKLLKLRTVDIKYIQLFSKFKFLAQLFLGGFPYVMNLNEIWSLTLCKMSVILLSYLLFNDILHDINDILHKIWKRFHAHKCQIRQIFLQDVGTNPLLLENFFITLKNCWSHLIEKNSIPKFLR